MHATPSPRTASTQISLLYKLCSHSPPSSGCLACPLALLSLAYLCSLRVPKSAGIATHPPTMSLTLNTDLPRAQHELHNPASCTSLSTFAEDLVDQLTDMDEDCVIEEAVIMNAKEVNKSEIHVAAPAVPKRSALRASRLMDGAQLKQAETTNPHDMYMSSEEDADASSSAGDFSADDYDFDSESESDGSEDRSTARRSSREDTARTVRVVFSGKPSMVQLRPISPLSPSKKTHTEPPAQLPTAFERAPIRRLPRPQSTMIMGGSRKPRPAFLNTDPFADQKYTQDPTRRDANNGNRPPTPKTAAFNLNRFQRSLGFARKPSRSDLKHASRRDSLTLTPPPRSGSTSNLLSLATAELDEAQASPASTTSTTPMPSPSTYQDVMRRARQSSISSLASMRPDTSAGPDSNKRGILSGLSISRRKSLSIRA